MIELQVNSVAYSDFTEATFTESMDNFSSEFMFMAVSDYRKAFPFVVGDTCSVFIDGTKKLTGYIDVISGSYTSDTHEIIIQGRSKISDLIDSQLESPITIVGSVTLQAFTEIILNSAGITGVEVTAPDGLKPLKDVESFAPGESAYEILETYARKLQVLLTSNENSNIVYARNSGISAGVSIINNGPDSNIKQASFTTDHSGRYNKYIIMAQQNPVGILSGISAEEVADQNSAPVLDTAIRTSRKLIMISEIASNREKAKERAQWEADIRRSRSVQYNATVQGHSHENGVWSKNTLVDVDDIYAGIRNQRLINSLSFTYSLERGSETVIGTMDKNAYTLNLFEPIQETVSTNVLNL